MHVIIAPVSVAQEFARKNPDVEAYQLELMHFHDIESDVLALPALYAIGPLELDTAVFREQLLQYVQTWRLKYSDDLHKMAKVRWASTLLLDVGVHRRALHWLSRDGCRLLFVGVALMCVCACVRVVAVSCRSKCLR